MTLDIFFFLFYIDPEEGVGNSHAALKHQTPVPEPTSPTTDDIQITMGEVILYHKKIYKRINEDSLSAKRTTYKLYI